MEKPSSTARRQRVLITERDRLILEMAAEHRLILPGHAAALLGVSPSTAGSRLRALARAGYLVARRLFAGQPTCYQVSRDGLQMIGSSLPRPQIDLSAYAHDVGVAWLWLAARSGTFGPMAAVLGERTLRSRDGKLAAVRKAGSDLDAETQPPPAQPYGVRLGGVGPHGRERLHYPDLLLVTPQGARIAIELELSGKGRSRREQILAGYGGDARIDAVLYLVDRPALARSIRASARRLGISSHVHVQWVRQPSPVGTRGSLAAQRAPRARDAGQALIGGRGPTRGRASTTRHAPTARADIARES
jgi:hypothetical protein